MYSAQGQSLPSAVELGLVCDPRLLRAELGALRTAGAPLAVAEGRRVLALHSPGGDPGRTDPGGPGLRGFAPTCWLEHAPLLAGILRSLPAPLRSVRLVALAPGAVLTKLQTAKIGPPWGLCRLHLPLVGGAESRVVFIDDKSHWQPGSLWFAASWRQHALVNHTDEELVHMVIDLHHTAALAGLFPTDLQACLRAPFVLERRPAVCLDPAELHHYICRFPLPEAFTNWENPGHFLPRDALRNVVPAEIVTHRSTLRLLVAGRPFCTLEHLGDGEFRMCGWSEERTLRVRAGAAGPAAVVVEAREGAYFYRVSLATEV
ncbi:aspartyl/asparaginyl beta-hydroxylase domain-containing protein [Streptomyces pimonensis]